MNVNYLEKIENTYTFLGNVFPQLLLARLFFSVGGAATATMVTAILPSMTARETDNSESSPISRSALPENVRNSIATESIDSEVTITPANYNGGRGSSLGDHPKPTKQSGSSPPRLAGLVGVFTGCGALVALIAFLPLPAQFSRMKRVSQGQAVADSEDGKGWRLLLSRPIARDTVEVDHSYHGRENTEKFQPCWKLISDSTILGFKDAQIGLGYVGGFVARASSVGISLFIPLYINSYFIGHGFCQGSPNDPSPELKKECRRAYVLAAELTGASQLIALLCAPLFGYLSDRYRRFNIPLLVASVFVFIMVALIGISQIGAIVCSLGLLGRGVLGDEGGYSLSSQLQDAVNAADPDSYDTNETAPLIASPMLIGVGAGIYREVQTAQIHR
ncbi:hypothetical protein DID88_006907 [Monilinia fructigena]|uniref:Uncharacterized protein n=1 Tax=Monilinia fructigena TaxID=38457 RepID=A0A395IG54_9HELO|nr:hypothetical protein DID88_006907 [Monilinia fructigena]